MPRLQRTHGLLQRFLERASDGHGLADRLHLGGQRGIGLWEFLEGEARHFDHTVVDGGLERRWGDAGNIIGDFVQQVAHG